MKNNSLRVSELGPFAKCTIGFERPVLGVDLEELRNKLGLGVGDSIWLFGMHTRAWYACTGQSDKQVCGGDNSSNDKYGPYKTLNKSLALLVRCLDVMPEYVDHVSLRVDSVTDLRERMSFVSDRELGELLGRDASASYRWLRQGAGANPTVQRLCSILVKWLDQNRTKHTSREITSKIDIWRNVVAAECAARMASPSYRKSVCNDSINQVMA